jgi:uncharacterized protein with HEPN domain
MDEADRYALTQMLRYSESAVRLLGAADEVLLAADERTLFAVSYAVQTVGEAAGRVSAGARAMLPEIPWRDVTGIRHHLVHGYQDVRLDILASTDRKDFPGLIRILQRAPEKGAP